MDVVGDAHEGRQPPGDAPGWLEAHRVDAAAAGDGVAVSWAVTARPRRGRAGLSALVLVPGRRPVVLVDHDVALPAQRWELRSSGLWADNVCETPLVHWSYGLEAFALEIDDPEELRGRGVGDRVAVGWELEFEASGSPVVESATAYRQPGLVHGLVMLGRDRWEVELPAVRRHWWGSVPDTLRGPAPAGAVALPEPEGCWWVALRPGGLDARFEPE
jgi:hypothetical protein